MTKDLEETLAGLGSGYGSVIERLRASRELEPSHIRRPRMAKRAAMLVAASALAVFGVAVVLSRVPCGTVARPAIVYEGVANEYSLAHSGDAAALREIMRTQNADGSWKNDFLTRQNAEALKRCSDPAAQVAYRKAARNLRMRGLL